MMCKLCKNIYILVLLDGLCCFAYGQKNEGDSCLDNYTNTAGVCTPTAKCEQAKLDFQTNGIQPTFCEFDTFGSSLICCKDTKTILHTAAGTSDNSRPVWGNSNRKRVSERKCEEYSRGVLERVDYIPLLPDPEPLTITASKCDYTAVELIVGGEAANRGEFPHMAALGWPNFEGGYTFLCGGTLISPRFVLSAGHCTSTSQSNLQNPSPTIVRLGDQNINPSVSDGADPIDVPIKQAHQHPNYNPPRTYDDIALFELNIDVELSASVRPACLWTREDFASYDKAIATGWGVTGTERNSKPSDELQKVSLSLLSNDYCDPLLFDLRNRKWDGFRPTQMCAGELRGKRDTCQGDSGGPLQVASMDNHCIFHVMGVTSFGKRCAESGIPAIYTRVSSYVDWIEKTVWSGE